MGCQRKEICREDIMKFCACGKEVKYLCKGKCPACYQRERRKELRVSVMGKYNCNRCNRKRNLCARGLCRPCYETTHKNPEVERRTRIKYAEKRRAYSRMWAKTHVTRMRERTRIANHKRRALLRKCSGNFTWNEWIDILFKYGNKCAFCGETEPEVKLTIDHIVPLSKGGNNTKENLQPACQDCNWKKNDNPDWHWKKDKKAFDIKIL